MDDVWFWQRIITPHMMGLARALADLGASVTYVAQDDMSRDRAQQGWLVPEPGGVRVVLAPDKKALKQLIWAAHHNSVHICQGIRANHLVGVAQRELARRGLLQWVVMETVHDPGLLGVFKRMEYTRVFKKYQGALQGVLAIGYKTPRWIVERGVPAFEVHPFAYFLDKPETGKTKQDKDCRFKFVFVGQFIRSKRLNWLIRALQSLRSDNFELIVIGSGPLEAALHNQAVEQLGEKVVWIGRLPSNEVGTYLAMADCLVLPSSFDGWGAVVSEALMCGTPVICSDTCGSAGVVSQSEVGGVFKADRFQELEKLLGQALQAGPVSGLERSKLAGWSETLSSGAGARYLIDILNCRRHNNSRPLQPWVVRQQ